jgi:hypothetical protein
VVDLFTCWNVSFGNHCNASIWNIIPLCIMWCILREHNEHSFEDCEKTTSELKLLLLKTLLDSCVAVFIIQTCLKFFISLIFVDS